MNRLLLTGNIILLGIVVIMSGFLLAPSRNAIPPPAPPYKSCYECGKDTFYGISVDDFMKGVARYRRTHSLAVNNEPYMKNNQMFDARSCWFSLDTLEKYICLIRKYSANKGVHESQLGVRFYYGVYPSDPAKMWDPNYISRHTLFMVPTYLYNGQNVDFDPRVSLDPLDTYFAPDPLTGVPSHTRRIMVMDLGGQQKTEGMAKNQGQLCPPNCPPDARSTLGNIDRSYPNETYQAN